MSEVPSLSVSPHRATISRLERSHPDSASLAEAYFHLGEQLKDQGELEGAESYFQKAKHIYERKVHASEVKRRSGSLDQQEVAPENH
jgi:TolA-binding protein